MKLMGYFIAFIAILVLSYFAVGFTSSITPPATGTTAGNQYANLTNVTGIASTGLQGTLLLVIGAMLLSGFGFFYYSINRRQ